MRGVVSSLIRELSAVLNETATEIVLLMFFFRTRPPGLSASRHCLLLVYPSNTSRGIVTPALNSAGGRDCGIRYAGKGSWLTGPTVYHRSAALGRNRSRGPPVRSAAFPDHCGARSHERRRACRAKFSRHQDLRTLSRYDDTDKTSRQGRKLRCRRVRRRPSFSDRALCTGIRKTAS